MIRIGVIGAGHLGKIHLNILKQLPDFEVTGFYDVKEKVREQVSLSTGLKAFKEAGELMEMCEAVDVVTPTTSHADYIVEALEKGKHVFIEKPITETAAQARYVEELSARTGLMVQVGHVERFNPAFTASVPFIKEPLFVEGHRLAQFNPRGTEVSVIHDLMIHDIDILLHCVKSEITGIKASGVAVVSDTPDIANARIEFSNGCVANLTASRISMKQMRKMRFFQHNAYISVDFLKRKAEVIRLKALEGQPGPLDMTIDLGSKGVKQIVYENPVVEEQNAIEQELKQFAASIRSGQAPPVNATDGRIALETAMLIAEAVESRMLSGRMES